MLDIHEISSLQELVIKFLDNQASIERARNIVIWLGKFSLDGVEGIYKRTGTFPIDAEVAVSKFKRDIEICLNEYPEINIEINRLEKTMGTLFTPEQILLASIINILAFKLYKALRECQE